MIPVTTHALAPEKHGETLAFDYLRLSNVLITSFRFPYDELADLTLVSERERDGIVTNLPEFPCP